MQLVRISGQLLILILLAAGCRPEAAAPTTSIRTEKSTRGPYYEAPETQANLGEVDFGKSYTHAFTVANVGDAPLRLTVARKSCACTDVEVTPAEIAPASKGTITLRWTPKPGQIGSHVVSADVETNSTGNQPPLRLEIKSQVNPLVRIWPEDWFDIDFLQIADRQPQQRDIKVFSTKLDDFDLDVRVSSPALEVITNKIRPGTLVGDAAIRSGYQVVVKTTDALPKGYFREQLTLEIKGPEPRQIVMPIFGEIESGALRVVPRVIELHTPRLRDGDSAKVLVQFTIPSEKETVEVVRTEPAFLQVDKPARVRNGLWQFAVRLPPGNAEAEKRQPDRFFDGKVVLKTSAVDEVPIRVKWVPPEK